MERYLVTGGAGFIGTNLVEALLHQGKTVRVLDNFATGKKENLMPFRHDVELIEGSILDLETVQRACRKVDVVLHQAALPSVPLSVSDPLASNAVNITGTLHVLFAARDAGVRRVVVASSCAVYGNSPLMPKVETMTLGPVSPYAVQKLACESYCESFSLIYGLPTIALRYFNVFGPRQDPGSYYSAVIPKFIRMMLAGEQPTVYGDGLQTRDFVFIDNVVQANLLAAKAPAHISGNFNVATGRSISLVTLIEKLNLILGTKLEPLHAPAAVGDLRVSEANIDKIGSTLRYTPRVSLEAGLLRTADTLRPAMPAQPARLQERAVGS
jgi:nucleoside-diphosphate-sugar epimerase